MKNPNEVTVMPKEKDYTKEIAAIVVAVVVIVLVICLIVLSAGTKVLMTAAEVMTQLES